MKKLFTLLCLVAQLALAQSPLIISPAPTPTPAPFRESLVSAHTKFPTQLSNGTDMGATYLIHFTARCNTSNLKFVFANSYNAAFASADTGPGNAITVTAKLNLGVQLTWGGSTTVVIPNRGLVESDPVGFDWKTASNGLDLAVHVHVANSGEKWPLGLYLSQFNSESAYTGATDQTSNLGALSPSNAQCFGPVAIIGMNGQNFPAVGLVGDSITDDTGDTSGGIHDYGWPRRLMDLYNVNWVKLAQSGNSLAGNGGSTTLAWSTYQNQFHFLRYCTHVVCALGTNEILNLSANLATVQANMLARWGQIAERGPKVIVPTILPAGTTASPANSGFASGGSSTRGLLNAWLRAGAPCTRSGSAGSYAYTATTGGAANAIYAGNPLHPAWKIIDITPYAETGVNTNQWISSYSGDNTHPSTTGATAIAAGAYAAYPTLFQ